MKMKIIRNVCLMILGCLMFNINVKAQAQSSSSKVLDGIYIKHRTATRKVISLPYISESNVMWQLRIWRVLDMRQKLNFPLYYPIQKKQGRKSLFQVIKMGIQEGTITPYGNPLNEDEFTTPLTIAEADNILRHMETFQQQDSLTGQMVQDSALVEVKGQDVVRFWIKEDWVFDKERSVLDVRIIGIAPMTQRINEDGTIRGYAPLFWVYFPECRYILANYETFNRHNDAQRLSYNDIFQDRMFSSYIRKKSNVYDRYLPDYLTPFNVLLESKKIKNNIFTFEHDLWHF